MKQRTRQIVSLVSAFSGSILMLICVQQSSVLVKVADRLAFLPVLIAGGGLMGFAMYILGKSD